MTDKLNNPASAGKEQETPSSTFDMPPSYEFISGKHLQDFNTKVGSFGGWNAEGGVEGIEGLDVDIKFDRGTFTVAKSADSTGVENILTVTAKSGGGGGGSLTVKGTPKNPPQDPPTFTNVDTINFVKGAKIYPPAPHVTHEVMIDFGFEISSYGDAGVIIDTNKIEFKGMDVNQEDGKAIVSPVGMDSLTDRHFSIFTVRNGLSAWLASSKALPYSLIQDPMCNISMPTTDRDVLIMQTTGLYAVTKYIHFTGKSEWAGKKAVVEFKLQQVTGQVLLSMTTEITADAEGEFPTVMFYKKSVSLDKNERIQVMVKITADSVAPTDDKYKDCEMDPYKNLLCLEKAGSKTHTGALISSGLFDSLGGVSYQPGVEIRGEFVPSGNPGQSGTYQVGAESFNKTIVVVTDREL